MKPKKLILKVKNFMYSFIANTRNIWLSSAPGTFQSDRNKSVHGTYRGERGQQNTEST